MYIPQLAEDNTDKTAMRAAHKAVRNAEGRSLPFAKDCACCVCGLTAALYHHESYAWDDRLRVVPMCTSCHMLLHRIGRDGLVKARIAKLEKEIHALNTLLNDDATRPQFRDGYQVEMQTYLEARGRLLEV